MVKRARGRSTEREMTIHVKWEDSEIAEACPLGIEVCVAPVSQRRLVGILEPTALARR